MAGRLVPTLIASFVMGLVLAACSGGSGSTAPAGGSTSAGAPASSPATEGSSGSAKTSAPPVTDADAVRDQLLGIAKTVHYSGTFKETPLQAAWKHAYPDMKDTLFDDQPASPDTFSMADSFTFSQKTSGDHGYDQILAFAVEDQQGTCAGGAVVVPQASAGHASDGPPTVFTPVDMAKAPECTAAAAQDDYAAAVG